MKKQLLILIAILSSAIVNGQDEGGVSLGAGPVYYNIDNSEINTFLDSYNEYYASFLSSEFSNLGMPLGYNVQLGGYANFGDFHMAIGFYRSNFSQKSEARFQAGNGRDIQLHFDRIGFYSDYGVAMGPASLAAVIGVSTWQYDVKSFSVLFDGTRSIGSESRLNGIYKSYHVTIDPGISFGINIAEVVRLEARALMVMPLVSATPTLLDLSDSKSVYTEFLPIHYEDISSLDQSKHMTGNLKGWSIAVTASFNLPIE